MGKGSGRGTRCLGASNQSTLVLCRKHGAAFLSASN
jgi:hypothetical protein